jgi:hypothetical protein
MTLLLLPVPVTNAHLQCPKDPKPKWLVLDLIEAAVVASLEDPHDKEAS